MAVPLLKKPTVKKRVKHFTRPQSNRKICVKARATGRDSPSLEGKPSYESSHGTPGRSRLKPRDESGIPPQPNNKECGYFVMRYMKDIIEDKDISFVNKWERRSSLVYTRVDIDEIRNEWARFVVNRYV